MEEDDSKEWGTGETDERKKKCAELFDVRHAICWTR